MRCAKLLLRANCLSSRRRQSHEPPALPKNKWLNRSAAAALPSPSRPQPQQKVFRYAFPSAETGFDPAQISDLYSTTITAHIFDSLYSYEYLARPARIRPLAAAALPDITNDFRTFTIRLRHGIYFQDDPAFKGSRRELIAQDFVYSLKRFFDPRWKSPLVSTLQELKILGLNELRSQALTNKAPFNYDTEVEGLRALDRYTLQIQLTETAPHLVESLAAPIRFWRCGARSSGSSR